MHDLDACWAIRERAESTPAMPRAITGRRCRRPRRRPPRRTRPPHRRTPTASRLALPAVIARAAPSSTRTAPTMRLPWRSQSLNAGSPRSPAAKNVPASRPASSSRQVVRRCDPDRDASAGRQLGGADLALHATTAGRRGAAELRLPAPRRRSRRRARPVSLARRSSRRALPSAGTASARRAAPRPARRARRCRRS